MTAAMRRTGEEPRRELLRLYAAPTSGVERFEVEIATSFLSHTSERGVVESLDRLLAQLKEDPSRSIVLLRLLDALPGLVATLDENALRDAGAARDGRAALVAALLGHSEGTDDDIDPLDAALLEGAEMGREMLDMEGGTWGIGQVAVHLGITRQAVAQRARRQRLLALAPGGHRQRFPAWQFAAAGVLPGFEEIAAGLAADGVDPWGRLLFFLSRQDDLAGTRPLDALRLGDLAGVRRAARRFGGGHVD